MIFFSNTQIYKIDVKFSFHKGRYSYIFIGLKNWLNFVIFLEKYRQSASENNNSYFFSIFINLMQSFFHCREEKICYHLDSRPLFLFATKYKVCRIPFTWLVTIASCLFTWFSYYVNVIILSDNHWIFSGFLFWYMIIDIFVYRRNYTLPWNVFKKVSQQN